MASTEDECLWRCISYIKIILADKRDFILPDHYGDFKMACNVAISEIRHGNCEYALVISRMKNADKTVKIYKAKRI